MNPGTTGRRCWLPACWLAALAGCQSTPAHQPAGTVFSGHMVERPMYRIAQVGGGEPIQYQRCLAAVCPVATPKTPVPDMPASPGLGAASGIAAGAPASAAPVADVFIIHFASGSSRLDARARRTLDVVARSGLGQGMVVAGRTDNLGDIAANTRLAQARAEAVIAYLRVKPPLAKVAMHIDARPRCCDLMDNASPSGRAANRRVEISALPLEGGRP